MAGIVPRILFFFFAYLTGAPVTRAQSLLLNGDFETVNSCTEFDAECAPEAWISSSPGFSNYFKDANRANSGQYCMAIDAGHSNKPFFRSFIRSRLLCAMRAGARYQLQFLIKSPHRILDSVGFYFGERDPLLERKPIHRLAPTAYIAASNPFRSDSSWQAVRITYTATGREAFFQLAYFGINDVTGSTGLERESRFQILVDDISLTPADPDESLCSGWEQRKQDIFEENARHQFLQRSLAIRRGENLTEPTLPKMQIPQVDTLTISDILFETGLSNLKKEYLEVLDSVCARQSGRHIDSLVIEGHTDDTGADTLNERLSRERALAVARHLRSCASLQSVFFRVEGRGSSRPLYPHTDPLSRQRNRRVELLIFYRE